MVCKRPLSNLFIRGSASNASLCKLVNLHQPPMAAYDAILPNPRRGGDFLSAPRTSRSSQTFPSQPPSALPSSRPTPTPSVAPNDAPQAAAAEPEPFDLFTPTAPTLQGTLTTYPSRMKLGLSSLMQPIPASVSQAKKQAELEAIQGRRSGRDRPNYAEMEMFDELDKTSDSEDDAPGLTARGRALAAQRRLREEGSNATTPRGTPQPERQKVIHYKSYMGQKPPRRLIFAESAKRAKHVYPSLEKLHDKAKHRATLIPIRIEVDTDTHRIRDCFVWNTAERFITPDLFAQTFCDDLNISQAYKDVIATSIREQISEHQPVAEIPILTEEQEFDHAEADVRVIVNLDVQIQTLHLVDKIEWDLSSPLTPELFALQLCAELGLTGEAVPLISHAIHDELLRHKKECLEIGLIARPEGEERTSTRGPKKLEGVWRDWSDTKEYGPKVEELSARDMEAVELTREQINKRMRRTTGQPSYKLGRKPK